MLDATLLHKMYPKAYALYIAWLNQKYETNGSKIYYHNDYLYFDKGNTSKLFEADNRHLFDFFDDYDIVLEVYQEHLLGKKSASTQWCFSVGIIISKGYPNRKLAEYAGFKQSFRILQKKL